MALYAFDGTGNSDDGPEEDDTNVVRFAEVYQGAQFEYLEGVGTRLGAVGKVLGGLFGAGGRSRIDEMYDTLCENFRAGDTAIDIVGYSRGAALAVHFANKLRKDGIPDQAGTPTIRFLGLFDLVASFGLSFNNVLDFQEMNIAWDVEEVPDNVVVCRHAMARDERREAFNVTRLTTASPGTDLQEVWFRGVHGDVGGGNGNTHRSNIALQWMFAEASGCGVPLNHQRASEARYALSPSKLVPPIAQNKDLAKDPRREVRPGDLEHDSVDARLALDESQTCRVLARQHYNWSGVTVEPGCTYRIEAAEDQTWQDDDIACDADGWTSSDLSWLREPFVEFLEKRRRARHENWFKLMGALGDEDGRLLPIGRSLLYSADTEADLYLFANDLRASYGNNSGFLDVTITRVT